MIPRVERIYRTNNNPKHTQQELKNLERNIKPREVQESKFIIMESYLDSLIAEEIYWFKNYLI